MKTRSNPTLPPPGLADFWVFGWAFALGALLAGLPLEGERDEWALYLGFGTLFPAGALALERYAPATARRALGAVAALGALGLVAHLFSPWAFVGAAAQLAIGEALRRGGLGPEPSPWPLAGRAGFALVAWSVAWRAVWWAAPGAWLGASAWTPICLLVSIAAAEHLFSPGRPLARPAAWAAAGIFALMFALGSSRVALDKDVEFLVGSASLVRQGGWLLWEVPSQYGFLDILTLAWAPFATVWQSVYFVNSSLIFLSALLVFVALRRLGSGGGQAVVAGLFAYALVLMMPGYVPMLMGPNSLPSVGAFRFVWCYALWGWVLGVPAPASRRAFWIGAAFWVLGVLWSVESACFVSAIWLPALALRGKGAKKDLLLSGGALGATIAAIIAWYGLRLGHAPELSAFAEYARSYQGGFGALPIDWKGAVWIPVLGFVLIVQAAVAAWGADRERFARLAASGGALWGVLSYFVSRSHENNLSNLAPLVALGFASPLLLGTAASDRRLRAFARACWIPLIAVIGTATWGNRARLAHHFQQVTERRSLAAIHGILPKQDEKLLELFQSAGVRPEDPIAHFSYRILFNAVPNGAPDDLRAQVPPFFLPVATASQLGILTPERQRTYLGRFATRRPRSGWLLEPKDMLSRSPPVVTLVSGDRVTHPELAAEVLAPTHHVTRRFENDAYRLEWFELKK